MNRVRRLLQNAGWPAAWYLLLLLTAGWLAAWGWHARAPQPWAKGWVGWFSGGREGSRPLWNWGSQSQLGWELATEKNGFYRVSINKPLGHWRYPDQPWSWVGWVRVRSEKEIPADLFHSVWNASSARLQTFVGVKNGRPFAWIDAFMSGSVVERVAIELSGRISFPLNKWVHLGLTTDGSHYKLILNGTLADAVTIAELEGLYLAELQLTSFATTTSPSPALATDHDDVVLYNRVVPPEEIAGLAAAGPGAWEAEMLRPERAAILLKVGLPVLFALASGLGILHFGIWLRPRAGKFWKVLFSPAGMPVGIALCAGFLATAILTFVVRHQGRKADEARFAGLLNQLRVDTDQYWEGLAAFLMRARDWVSNQGELHPEKWHAWLKSNHFPHDYPGVIGIGYAEQLLPEQLAEHEKRWSQHYGFTYQVNPPKAVRHNFEDFELLGNPRLPVVLFHPAGLRDEKWRTNQTILGRDLLQHTPGDFRNWPDARRVEKAVARDEITSSDVEQIAPAEWYGAARDGLRLYVPLTFERKKNDSRPLEAGKWRGVVFANVDMRELIRLHFSTAPPPFGFRLFTGIRSQRLQVVADTSDIFPSGTRSSAYLASSFRTPLYHFELLFDAWTTPAFEAASSRRWPMITAAAGAIFTLLAAGLVYLQAQKRYEQAALITALTAANSELIALNRERERLSRDLHDGSIQNLYGLGLLLKRLEQLLANKFPDAHAGLQQALLMLDESIAELRKYVTPEEPAPTENTTATAIVSLVDRWRADSGLDIQIQLHPSTAELPPRTGIHLLNILREAISNGSRHSGARTLKISLGPQADNKDHWQLAIEDDGRGFDVDRPTGAGRGLKNFAARAAELGGTARVESEPARGTRVYVFFPAERTTLETFNLTS